MICIFPAVIQDLRSSSLVFIIFVDKQTGFQSNPNTQTSACVLSCIKFTGYAGSAFERLSAELQQVTKQTYVCLQLCQRIRIIESWDHEVGKDLTNHLVQLSSHCPCCHKLLNGILQLLIQTEVKISNLFGSSATLLQIFLGFISILCK